jgi:hypothetical protein
MKSTIIMAGVAMALSAGTAQAVVHDVASLTITSANATWIQVAEVQAFEALTGTNVALASNGGVATAPNTYDGTLPAAAIDGIAPQSYPNIYHSAGTPADYLTVTFAGTFDLASLTIFGRADCCRERDVFDFALHDAAGGLLYSGTLDARGGSASVVLPDVAAAVPEPASWAMMVAGFGIVGSAMRRRVSKFSLAV